MTPDLAAKLEAAECKLHPQKPVHMTKDVAVSLLEQRERVRSTLDWLRQYLTDNRDSKVSASETWNRLSMNYFDPAKKDPEELPPDPDES